MASINEKAVPVVAVAAPLRNTQKYSSQRCLSFQKFSLDRCTGVVACGLPLPQESGVGFHVNGYFDVDSSRTAITLN